MGRSQTGRSEDPHLWSSEQAIRRCHQVLAALSLKGTEVPAVIPVSGVRYPCVTLPFATNRQMQAKDGPYDLHVLAMPPAFVLSQDQTLHFFLLPGPKRPVVSRSGLYTHVCIRECSSDSSEDEPTPSPVAIATGSCDAELIVQRSSAPSHSRGLGPLFTCQISPHPDYSGRPSIVSQPPRIATPSCRDFPGMIPRSTGRTPRTPAKWGSRQDSAAHQPRGHRVRRSPTRNTPEPLPSSPATGGNYARLVLPTGRDTCKPQHLSTIRRDRPWVASCYPAKGCASRALGAPGLAQAAGLGLSSVARRCTR